MARLSREVLLTEKIDGTSACILIEPLNELRSPAGSVYSNAQLGLWAGSRTRWITPKADNFGFARWCKEHGDELLGLGEGRHFGEFWGGSIQRGYGLKEKRLSLFNVQRWVAHGQTPGFVNGTDGRMQEVLPPCVGLVPILWRGEFDTRIVERELHVLKECGSKAVIGFMDPEGVVVHHIAGNVSFKKTIAKDNEPKSLQ